MGGVDALFVEPRSSVWGEIDPQSFAVTLFDRPPKKQARGEDLIDRATVDTIDREGDVLFLTKEEFTAATPPLAGTFRFPVPPLGD